MFAPDLRALSPAFLAELLEGKSAACPQCTGCRIWKQTIWLASGSKENYQMEQNQQTAKQSETGADTQTPNHADLQLSPIFRKQTPAARFHMRTNLTMRPVTYRMVVNGIIDKCRSRSNSEMLKTTAGSSTVATSGDLLSHSSPGDVVLKDWDCMTCGSMCIGLLLNKII